MPEHVPSRLRYVDADQLDSRVLDLDGLDVRNQREDHIGDVEGLLVDSISGRPRYLVIDSGGWFRSRRFLLPIAHARLDEDRRTLRVDFDKETINRFPEMRTDRYDALTDDELGQYDEGVWHARGVTHTTRADARGPEYNTSPSWWHTDAWASTPVPGPSTASGGRPMYASEEVMARSEDQVRARAEHERMLARERDDRRARETFVDRDNDRLVGSDVAATDTYVDRDERGDRDDLRAPAVGERAQPGDILGIESAGETTTLGDTARDEDKRREQAEKDIRDMDLETERRDRKRD